ncbi:mediator of RNA polymerase II transcription subunit 8-like isoform X2 [Teleopsis dalmanni]|nr:mediator of RNA polymerase II transcription subunit 8-like isoform X2 [Teleopsis dalmanni]
MISDQFDEALFTLTDGRMPAFTKDVMQNALSTEPDSFVKEKFSQNKQKVSSDSVLNRKEFNNKITEVLDAIAVYHEKSKRYKRKSKKKRIQKQQRIGDDTLELVTFVTMGKSLNSETPLPVASLDNAANAAIATNAAIAANAAIADTAAVPDTITVDTITEPVVKPRIKIRELSKNQKFK